MRNSPTGGKRGVNHTPRPVASLDPLYVSHPGPRTLRLPPRVCATQPLEDQDIHRENRVEKPERPSKILRDLSVWGGTIPVLMRRSGPHGVDRQRERPAHPWTLDELADMAGMSRARFAVNFREAVGLTPLDYLTDWRMSIAQNLLKLGRPIKSVAAAVGYQSQAALARVFAKRIGHAPTDWLKQMETQ